ncbi:MAG: hypothetical protein U1F08_09855 [Steroidobacteraceae bacterium]
MKWMDTLHDIAQAMDLEPADHRPAESPVAWDPYDVWLTRIHRPRMARIGWVQPRPARPGRELPSPG